MIYRYEIYLGGRVWKRKLYDGVYTQHLVSVMKQKLKLRGLNDDIVKIRIIQSSRHYRETVTKVTYI